MAIFSKKETEEEPVEQPGMEDVDEEGEAEEEPSCDFVIGSTSYVVAFTQKRIDMYERANKPVMSSFVQNGGAFSLAELKGLTAYGLRREGGAFVNPKKGMEMAEGLLEENGYLAVYQRVVEALERDCGFLFKGATG